MLQPFDVGVFLLLKKSHQRVLRKRIMEGALTFTRHDFVASLHQILREGFRAHYLMNGFEDAGIWPVNPGRVLERMTQQAQKEDEVLYPSHLPNDNRFQTAISAAEHLDRGYGQLLSSPTRAGLVEVQAVLAEAVTIKHHLDSFTKDRQQCLQQLSHKKRIHHGVEPNGDLITSIRLQDLRDILKLQNEKREKEEQLRQLKCTKKLVQERERELRAQWKRLCQKHCTRLCEIDGVATV